MAQPLKILVCGDVEGRFGQLFTRVRMIQKKAGQFDMLFCVGNFFGEENAEWEEYANARQPVPIQTYVLGPCQTQHNKYYTDPNGCELCDNITYLGHKGTLSGSSGLQVAYLSGTESSTADSIHFDRSEVESLTQPICETPKFQGIDILLTSQWPSGVEKYASNVDGVNTAKDGSALVSQMALMLKPRYHFCGLQGTFYERQPYRNHKVLAEAAEHVTRFIALSNVGNPQKQKYIYAFNVTPMKEVDQAELTKQPEDSTECPYLANPGLLSSSSEAGEGGVQFFYDPRALQKGDGSKGRKRPHDKDRDGGFQHKKPPAPKGPCWFCLGSPEVEKHLVVSVGIHNYLALAKGGLTPDHILILPITHHQCLVSAPPAILDEITKYKDALKKCFKSQGKAVVFFERNYRTQHLQIQAVPIPSHLAGDVKDVMISAALDNKFELHEIPPHSDLKQIVPGGAPYFYAELPGGEKLLHRISKGIPLQFGREALARQELLNMPDRVDWRFCKASNEDEVQMKNVFREAFTKYDFTL